MLLILPNERNGLTEIENSLLAVNYTPVNKLLKRLHHLPDVSLTPPKFKITFKSEMKDILTRVSIHVIGYNIRIRTCLIVDRLFTSFKMGVVDLFSPEAANLTGICQCRKLKVNVLHESSVKVNELGTEAAAFTGIIANFNL